MKQNSLFRWILVFYLIFLFSCQKDEPEEPAIGNGFFRFKFGTEYLEYDELPKTTGGPSFGSTYQANSNGGELTLIRHGKIPDTRYLQLRITGIDLDKVPIPCELNKTYKGPIIKFASGILLFDLATSSHININGSTDSYNYSGSIEDDVIIRLDSKKDDIIRGSFEGKVKTKSGLVKTVTEGKFAIKIVRI